MKNNVILLKNILLSFLCLWCSVAWTMDSSSDEGSASSSRSVTILNVTPSDSSGNSRDSSPGSSENSISSCSSDSVVVRRPGSLSCKISGANTETSSEFEVIKKEELEKQYKAAEEKINNLESEKTKTEFLTLLRQRNGTRLVALATMQKKLREIQVPEEQKKEISGLINRLAHSRTSDELQKDRLRSSLGSQGFSVKDFGSGNVEILTREVGRSRRLSHSAVQ